MPPAVRSLIVAHHETLAPVVFGTLALTEVLSSPALSGPATLNALCVVAMAAPLGLLRVAPLSAVAVALTAATVHTAALTPATDLVSHLVLLALVACGAAVWARGRTAAAVALALCLAQPWIALVLLTGDPWGDGLYLSTFALACWLVGSVLRVRRQAAAERGRAARERVAQAERERFAAEAERARVARELHDVVAHAVTVATIQSQVAREALPPGADESRAALEALERACRAALEDLRRMLGVLRGEHATREPPPGLDDLHALVETARATGRDVALHVDPAALAGLPAAASTVHRIVQEGVTNALRHAPGAPVEIVVGRRDHELLVQVRNGPGEDPAIPASAGAGLAGVRERVALWDGRMDAGPSTDGGWALVARLPASGAVAA